MDVITKDQTSPSPSAGDITAYDSWRKKDIKARLLISSSVDAENYEYIIEAVSKRDYGYPYSNLLQINRDTK